LAENSTAITPVNLIGGGGAAGVPVNFGYCLLSGIAEQLVYRDRIATTLLPCPPIASAFAADNNVADLYQKPAEKYVEEPTVVAVGSLVDCFDPRC
jgi:hypothetical protein